MKTRIIPTCIAWALLSLLPRMYADPVSVTSEPFDVLPAPAAEFVFTEQPDTTGAGQTTVFTVQTLDEFGNVTNDHGGF